MALKKKATKKEAVAPSEEVEAPSEATQGRRPRLRRMTIRNLGCIGPKAVTVELDEIVVLVGRNNAGKSTVLRAYALIMAEQAAAGQLAPEDFPGGKIPEKPDLLPQVELETIVYDNAPGAQWVDRQTGEGVVRERWTWAAPKEPPTRETWSPAENRFTSGLAWGPGNIAQAFRPAPHRIDAFSSPEKHEEEVKKLLLGALKDRVKSVAPSESTGEGQPPTLFERLLGSMADLQKQVVQHAKEEIEKAQGALSRFVDEVFPGYRVRFEASAEEELAESVQFFKAGAQLRMGPSDGYSGVMERQGSGARRTLMWAAIRYLGENGKVKNGSTRPHLLLVDEPELCLHPNAVRDARRALYNLPQAGNWQVMVTTHSPVFIDLSRDNTTVVRVERTKQDGVRTTTVFRGENASLSEDDRAQLKLLNLFDPNVAEFFFGGHVILVEGDTEYTAFNYIISQNEGDPAFRDLHIIRARGKATIELLARILNNFEARYAVLHDSDMPTTQREGKTVKNGAWSVNESIRSRLDAPIKFGRARLVASLDHFEAAVFGTSAENEKPYRALEALREDEAARKKVESLLRALIDFSHELPSGFAEWSSLEELELLRTEAANQKKAV
jgi:putative ATP-dependent endonuclease of the OLD family